MSEKVDIPEGYIVVKKGGRPKSTLRDLAVFIAYKLKTRELGKGYLANEWIIEKFGLNDAGHIRTCRRNAGNILKKQWVAIVINSRTVYIFPTIITAEGSVTTPEGSVGWGWAEGCATAVEVKVGGFTIAGPAANKPGTNWKLQTTDNW